jgi:hypothetical protein
MSPNTACERSRSTRRGRRAGSGFHDRAAKYGKYACGEQQQQAETRSEHEGLPFYFAVPALAGVWKPSDGWGRRAQPSHQLEAESAGKRPSTYTIGRRTRKRDPHLPSSTNVEAPYTSPTNESTSMTRCRSPGPSPATARRRSRPPAHRTRPSLRPPTLRHADGGPATGGHSARHDSFSAASEGHQNLVPRFRSGACW